MKDEHKQQQTSIVMHAINVNVALLGACKLYQ